jgi:hypothetical protein
MATGSGVTVDDEADHGLYTDDSQQRLDEFVCTHTLPIGVAVTRGSFMSSEAMIARGDVLLLRGLSTNAVTLSFTDTETGQKRQVVVAPDIPVKFFVLPPKGSEDSSADQEEDETAVPRQAYFSISFCTRVQPVRVFLLYQVSL